MVAAAEAAEEEGDSRAADQDIRVAVGPVGSNQAEGGPGPDTHSLDVQHTVAAGAAGGSLAGAVGIPEGLDILGAGCRHEERSDSNLVADSMGADAAAAAAVVGSAGDMGIGQAAAVEYAPEEEELLAGR